MTLNPVKNDTRESQFDPMDIIRSGQRKYRASGSGRAAVPAPGRSEQHLGPGSAFLRVALFSSPSSASTSPTSSLWTYCMSSYTRAAPGVGKGVRMKQRTGSCDQRKPNLAENQSWFPLSWALIFKQELSDASIQRALGVPCACHCAPGLLSIYMPLQFSSSEKV